MIDFVARKYRDELRPRQGLFRTREFLMKDLYTFDTNRDEALKTYETVRQAYSEFFNAFKIPYLTAQASSGEIGGDLSHEYHIPSSKGEDNVIVCNECGYVANEELAAADISLDLSVEDEGTTENPSEGIKTLCSSWYGITKDRSTLVHAVFPKRVRVRTGSGSSWRETKINPYALKSHVLELDTSVESPRAAFEETPRSQRKEIKIYDKRLPSSTVNGVTTISSDDAIIESKLQEMVNADLIRIETGDHCANCHSGILTVQSAVELGHTFHLGTRYSVPLDATVAADPSLKSINDDPNNNLQAGQSSSQTPIQMGCHGIGVSRLIGAVADSLADSKGLNWPSVMAPFQTVIVPTRGQEAEAADVYDLLKVDAKSHSTGVFIDTILDDRKRDFGWKLKDADMIGYPVIVVVGRDWKVGRKVEVQCRRLGVKQVIDADQLRIFVQGLLDQL